MIEIKLIEEMIKDLGLNDDVPRGSCWPECIVSMCEKLIRKGWRKTL